MRRLNPFAALRRVFDRRPQARSNDDNDRLLDYPAAYELEETFRLEARQEIGPEMAISSPGLSTHEHRREIVARMYSVCATNMLQGEHPDNFHLGLLTITFAEAAIAGDRALLRGGVIVVERLLHYLPDDLAWSGDVGGRLGTLELQARGSLTFLDRERLAAGASS